MRHVYIGCLTRKFAFTIVDKLVHIKTSENKKTHYCLLKAQEPCHNHPELLRFCEFVVDIMHAVIHSGSVSISVRICRNSEKKRAALTFVKYTGFDESLIILRLCQSHIIKSNLDESYALVYSLIAPS